MINKTILKSCCSERISEEELYEAYKIFFATLVSESRLRILNLLRKKEMNVSEIIKKLNADQTAVSHDLARLKTCGFVVSIVKGKFRYYKISTKTIKPLMNLIDEHMSSNCVHILRNKPNKGGKNEK